LGQPITSSTPTLATGSAVSYSVSPSLPAGLTINSATGVISGTPTGNPSSSATYTVTATDAAGVTATCPVQIGVGKYLV